MDLEKNISRIFWLQDDKWLNHANPISVRTRFIILPFIVLAIRSRVWFGCFCIIFVFIILIWVFINPIFFKKPKTTNNWASKCVLWEMILSNSNNIKIPNHHIIAKNILLVIQLIGLIVLIYGLYYLYFWPTLLWCVLIYFGKMWFLDRMVWLCEDMKNHPEYKKIFY